MGKTLKESTPEKKGGMPGGNIGMALSFGLLNAADYVTTKKILNTGGEELNPIAAFLIKKKCFGIVKIAATLAGMYTICEEEKPTIVGPALLAYYGFLVGHNLKEIVRYRRIVNKGTS